MSEAISRPFIHFHLPKTAGTSLRATFIKSLGAENVAFMMPDRRLVRTSDLPFETEQLDTARRAAREAGRLSLFSAEVNAINREKVTNTFPLSEMVTRGVALATGHFVHTDVPETFAGMPRTTIVRDPLARMWSHYAHWREARGTMWWHTGSVPYADDTRFEDFATDPTLANYQAGRLGDLDYAVVGATDNLPAFLTSVGLDATNHIPTLNPGNYRQSPDFDPGFVRDFTTMNTADYELYETALH